ncbi:DNA topoisomerase IB [Salipiger sp. IMCC34102]|uniref:DNA topoisomerase IB n=1 Tax=Salipiger sp. IMCC34102 TaxID=2510647 RepID=UPI00101CD516|nr:DNA topoisomerase IB [Salipiger sp. IMCC34102]RYH03900.1 DNA topoisomerase IB [Salipiger sp. IMCC34102]
MSFTDIPKGHGLVYYPDSEPGIARRRAGRGFSYTGPDGTRIERGPERDRIEALGIPPAYADVWISPMVQGHLQATGLDERERKQYRYHDDWTRLHAQLKFDRLADLVATLPRLRRWIETRLRGEAGSFDVALAATLALIDRAALRVGHESYTQDNGSYGATTLLQEHVTVTGGSIALDFTGKSGKRVEREIYAPRLAAILEDCQDLPGAEVVSWQDDAGASHAIRSEHINDVLKDLCGPQVTAKTLRTWTGTVAAYRAAREAETLTIKTMAEAAAARLNNTATVARNSYIHPAVIELAELSDAERNRLFKRLDKTGSVAGLRAGEAELGAYLAAG